MKVSIVIPVYNAQSYLKKCIKSLLNQTHSNLEVICVNDGSTDQSLDIIISFSYMDKRLTYISQENQGQSAARNKGIEICTGDYIFFLDADDSISLDCIELLMKSCQQQPNMIASTEVRKFCSNGVELEAGNTHKVGSYSNCDVMKGLYSQTVSAVVWGKLFPASLIKQQCFLLDLTVGEDLVYLVQFFQKNNYGLIVREHAVYNYLILPGSTSRSISPEKIVADLKKVKVLKMLDVYGAYESELINMVGRSVWSSCAQIIKQTMTFKDKKYFIALVNNALIEFDLKSYFSFPIIIKKSCNKHVLVAYLLSNKYFSYASLYAIKLIYKK